MYYVVTPSLLQWMKTVIETQLANGKELESSVVFYHRLLDLTGLVPNGLPARPKQFDVIDHRDVLAAFPFTIALRKFDRASLSEI
jgi:hypothetical protein